MARTMPSLYPGGYRLHRLQPRNYPNLTALFRSLGVAGAKKRHELAASRSAMAGSNGALRVWVPSSASAAISCGRVFALARVRCHAVQCEARCGARSVSAFHACVTTDLADRRVWADWFRRYYLLPMAGAIWSCPPARCCAFPAWTLVRFSSTIVCWA